MFSYGVRFLFPPPIGSWESLVDVVAGSSPVGGTRSYCIPNRAGESQFPSVSPPEPTIGLSPRVRGNRLCRPSPSSPQGSIPACAGEPSIREGKRQPEEVYPRVCGGTIGSTRRRTFVNGLSPRVRGNLAVSQPATSSRRSIPACAGEPPSVQHGAVSQRVYPRVCGGTVRGRIYIPHRHGLSPRVCGNLTALTRSAVPPRSIPACAGEPRRDDRGTR